ncbi:PREDICTED: NACHT, LRR and PYD domains-containing protein 3-like [Branchiostoma belcheri]|uniref:NACHT, LRR and PYD domains-containing protein 3-like n=1 Tax=Branchiostoma belcheri TaxID=7741 RepID=A0A6P5A380_BRABE|nr:PREDICTED: NACHT, LRR and PYD domains-containing protein 3-like [Branchiostoma belcheri]
MAEGKHDNTAGVRKYFFFIKENVSSDWKDLAFHLDFRRSDTDNISGRNLDDKSRCMDLLEEWLKCNGERATVEVLMEALSQSNLQSTVDGLKNKYPELKTSQASSSQQEMKELFQKSVQKYYELKLTYFKPLIWNDNFTVTLSDIFTQLELIPIQEKQLKMSDGNQVWRGHGTKLKSLDDLFKPDDGTGQAKAPRCILIEGEAGGGKTTFLSKAALDALSQKTELGKRHDIVLLIRLREVREGETIDEMVWDQCVPETTEGVDVESIRAILQRNESRVLFLLDGYDELRPEAKADRQAIPKLLDGKLYPNSTIVITSRPSAGVQQYTRPDCHVHVLGFSTAQVVQYIRQYFSKNSEQGEHLINQHFSIESSRNIPFLEFITVRSESRIAEDLIHTPIFLLLVCVLWEEDQETVSTGTRTGPYGNLLTCLVRKYCKREGVDMPTDGLPTEVADSLLHFGKLALEALQRNEALIDLAEVERENVNWELLLKLGVVSLEVSASKLHPRKQLNFSHKTMQEFLAGRYVSHALVNQDVGELLDLSSVRKAFQLKNLLRFTCGFNSQVAQAIFTELSNLRSKVFPHVHVGRFKERIKADNENTKRAYEYFTFLCLDLLQERRGDQDVLRAAISALPVIFIDLRTKPQYDLLYYLAYLPSQHPSKVILFVHFDGVPENLERFFDTLCHHPRLDLRVRIPSFGSPDKSAKLVSVLKNVPGLMALNLSFANLTPSSLQQVVQEFSHMSQLEELDLSLNPDLGDAGMDVLKDGLSSIPKLTVLRLRGYFGDGMTALGIASMTPYMRHLAGLRELDITDNEIGDTGLESLTDVLHVFTALQVLGLRRTRISSAGMRTLVPTLCKLTKMMELDISNNIDIGDPGLECLVDHLPHLTGMKVLKMWNIGFTDRGIFALVEALPHLPELQVLDVRYNNIDESGIVSLVQTICQLVDGNSTVQELHIGINKGVTGATLETITQLISALPSLTELDLSGHYDEPAHLSDTAASTLAEALPRLPALEKLSLSNISVGSEGFKVVMQAAEEHPKLDELSYSPRDPFPEEVYTSDTCLTFIK